MADAPDGEGTYSLVLRLPAAATVAVGALGERRFPAGWYVYTGSAFGPGGFARVARHRELAAGERDARHWHVDHLLCHPETTVERVVTSADADVECAVAQALPAGPVEGFGASDCDCPTHLARFDDREGALSAARRAHERATGTTGTDR